MKNTQLPIFDYIDEVIAIREAKEPIYRRAAQDLADFFRSSLFTKVQDEILEIRTRVKALDSLREKIIRKKFYKQFNRPEDVLLNLSDLIGVRIQCRFKIEEEEIFSFLKEVMTEVGSDGLYYSRTNPAVRLELAQDQPQVQTNGFTIYRIDGFYAVGEEVVRFELQIKSMVSDFWGDIEHKLIYKNNNYLMMDQFLKELMSSVYESLSVTDRQLYLINDRLGGGSNAYVGAERESMKALIAKTLNDLFVEKMDTSMGFTVDFKETCEIISIYYMVCRNVENQEDFSKAFLELFQRLKTIQKQDISFREPISMEGEFRPWNRFSKILGERLLALINQDFEWNLFFRILFLIEPGNNMEDFCVFLHVMQDQTLSLLMESELNDRLVDRLGASAAQRFHQEVEEICAYVLTDLEDIRIIYTRNVNQVRDVFLQFVSEILDNPDSVEEWKGDKESVLERLEQAIRGIF
ncbi:hypothetical protein [Bianquea renquensis]|uniref:RelA/SpoT domain-containing protein n=1 Tax=Bianquea renquensis TaxID=2763661 RepID=A0A926I0U9_9FIRM|nr:hypothetical protein [Bianquea renquensis]MBC8542301.1 hypothetical protein [Bianquea renquensis]